MMSRRNPADYDRRVGRYASGFRRIFDAVNSVFRYEWAPRLDRLQAANKQVSGREQLSV